MIFAYALALHALTHQDTKEIPVQWVRPSKILALMKDNKLTDADVTADDVKGVLIVKGSDEDIRGFQTYVNLFDVHRRSVSLKVSVDSKIDRLSYQCDATIANNQTWKTTDNEIGIVTSISPRINDDNTITLYVEFSTEKMKPVKVVARVKMRETAIFSIGKNGLKYIYGPNSDNTPKLAGAEALDPQIKITPSIN